MPRRKEPKLTNRKDGRAVVHWKGKMYVMGQTGTPEAQKAYHRFCLELHNAPIEPAVLAGKCCSVNELVAGFLDYCQPRQDKIQFSHNKYAIGYLVEIYGDLSVNEFSPKKLKICRNQMIKTGRMCRRHINDYTRRIVRLFSWGVEEELVKPDIVAALREVKALRKGEDGSFDNPPRKAVPDDVVLRTLPFLPPTLRAMVQIQRLTGMRPSEVYRMTVGEIDRTRGNGLWYYTPSKHKTEEHIGQKSVPLGKPEQELIAPYLKGKKPTEAVFSPKQAMKERAGEKRTARKSKITPSQASRDKSRAENPVEYEEFYDASSYRKAVGHAIKAANKEGQNVPHWTPYQLRHSAGTAIEKMEGLDKAQALLGHTSAETTKRYAHAQLAITEELARNRKNPFEPETPIEK